MGVTSTASRTISLTSNSTRRCPPFLSRTRLHIGTVRLVTVNHIFSKARHNKVHRRPPKQVRDVTVPVQFSDTFSSINPCAPRHVTRPTRRRRRRRWRRTCRCTKLAAGYASLMHLGRTGQVVHCTSAGDGTARRHVTVVACVGSDHRPSDRWMGSSSWATTSRRSLARGHEVFPED